MLHAAPELRKLRVLVVDDEPRILSLVGEYLAADQLAAAAKRLSPETPIVLLTGFGELMADQNERPEGVDLIVSKPVTMSALRDAMAKLIAA